MRWENVDNMVQDGKVTLYPFYPYMVMRPQQVIKGPRSESQEEVSWRKSSGPLTFSTEPDIEPWHWTLWNLACLHTKLGPGSPMAPLSLAGHTDRVGSERLQHNTQTQQWPHHRTLVLEALPDREQSMDNPRHVHWSWFWQPRAAHGLVASPELRPTGLSSGEKLLPMGREI